MTLPADAYYEQTLPNDVAVSPDGERIAFVATEFDGAEDEEVTSVFVTPTDGSRDPHRLTRVESAWSPAWSPDGSKLAFAAVRDADAELAAGRPPEDEADADPDDEAEGDDAEDEEDGDDAGDGDGDDEEDDEFHADEVQVWVFDMERGGDARQVTTREEGVEAFDWGPAGERIVVEARDPTEEEREYLDEREDGGPIEVERLQHKMEGRGFLDSVTRYLFVVDVDAREERRLDDATVEGVMTEFPTFTSLAWGEAGIAYSSYVGEDPDEGYEAAIRLADPEDGDVRTVTSGDWSDVGPTWGPGGERLAFVRRDPENWHVPADVCTVDATADDSAAATLSEGLDRSVMGVDWLPDGRVLGLVADEGATRCYAFEAGTDPRRVDALGGDYEGAVVLDTAADAPTVGATLTAPDEQNVYAADLPHDGEATRRRLTDFNGEIVEAAPLTCTRVTVESEDGTAVEAFVSAPAGADLDGDGPEDPLPLVVDIHGGPMSFDGPRYGFGDRFWTSRGYAVLKVNYRGSTSYGRAFSEEIRGEWGTRETEDVVAGVEALADRGWTDPERTFVTGFSYGGIGTAFVLSQSDVATAGAAQHGIYDLRSAFGTDDSHNWFENDFGLPWEAPERYDAGSSITDVDEIDDPLLVTAGENDHRCPPSQAEQLYVSVRKQGVPAKLVVYPETGHAYGGPDYATHRLETIEAWFREHDPAVDESESEEADADE